LALVQDPRDTMAARDGAGLAAPQIGVPLVREVEGFHARLVLQYEGGGAARPGTADLSPQRSATQQGP